MKTTVSTTQVLLLADGDTVAAKSNARGHLFEEFVAQLMALFGYEKPTRADLNNTSHGIELDVSSRHTLTNQRMIAECKAYSSSVEGRELSAFYGKLGAERLDHSDTVGYFIAIPGLTKNGRELQAKLEAKDTRFRGYDADGILSLLLDRGVVQPIPEVVAHLGAPTGPLSDEALLVTKHGLYYAAYELAGDTRLPKRVLLYPSTVGGSVPTAVVELLSATSGYARGLPCVEASAGGSSKRSVADAHAHDDTVIEVTGSSSDFEYQYPAAPQYFVGRQHIVTDAKALLENLALERDARAKVLVLNAQSGWGKSSLALRIIELARTAGGAGVCIDCRTASNPTFVPAAIRHALFKAGTAGLLTLPESASFASVMSVLETIKLTRFAHNKPLAIFFDQFENIFQNIPLTTAFRDLALGIVDLNAPILLGFAWKTDFVAFTEQYPYQLRDDIRSRATVVALPPLGPAETSELLSRLQRSCGQRIHPYLRERLREYSQGLPWLFKKLGSHIIREITKGTTQDQLLTEALNVQVLFESDMSGLSVHERHALKAIAKRVPLSVTEAVEIAASRADVVQSLLNQRLLVSIGEKLDVYWDVFRDYLNQGTVPLQDSYILRLTPNTTRKLLALIKDLGGATTPEEAARQLATSQISVLNMARDLRQLGVLAAQEGILRFADDIAAAPDLNLAIQARVLVALKRHRVYSLLVSLSPGGTRLPLAAFGDALPKEYPAVAAKRATWMNYSRAFAYWFQFAGLASMNRDEIWAGAATPTHMDLTTPGKRRLTRGVTVFPRCPVGPVLELVGRLGARRSVQDSSTARKALADARLLGIVSDDEARPRLTQDGISLAKATGPARASLLRQVIAGQPSIRIAERLLMKDPGASPITIGREVAREIGIGWSDATALWVGKSLRGWMRAAGFKTAARPRSGAV